MKIYQSPYVLIPKDRMNAVQQKAQYAGTLIKIYNPETQQSGYSDLFPLEFLNDKKLDFHFTSLKEGQPSQLMQVSLLRAFNDLEARQKGASLFKQYRVKSNYLVSDIKKNSTESISDAMNKGFDRFKIKCDQDVLGLAKILNSIKWGSSFLRLDFNSSADLESIEKLLSALSDSVRQRIEYIEDPFPWNETTWKILNKQIPLAIDQDLNLENIKSIDAFSYAIIKPARFSDADIDQIIDSSKIKFILTSSMDHQVGILHAIACHSRLSVKYPNRIHPIGGFLTQSFYSVFPMLGAVIIDGPELIMPNEIGIGLGEELSGLTWTEL